MTTNDDQCVPHESYVREAWVDRHGTGNPLFVDEAEAEFDRFLARIRCDAAREALDGLAAAEHRATRAEAQSAIRGRAVAIHRERTREAEARIKAVRDVLDNIDTSNDPALHDGFADILHALDA